MKNCEDYKNLIEKYLDGMITDVELSQLQKHVEECSSCRTEFDRSTFLKDAVKQAFSSHTSAEQAGAQVVARLSTEPGRHMRPACKGAFLSFGRQAAVAASIVLVIGLFLGFALGRAGTGTPVDDKGKSPICIS